MHASCDAELGNLAHLALILSANLVRGTPPHLHAFHLGSTVPRVPDLDVLRDTAALLGCQGAACLGLELEFVALGLISTSSSPICIVDGPKAREVGKLGGIYLGYSELKVKLADERGCVVREGKVDAQSVGTTWASASVHVDADVAVADRQTVLLGLAGCLRRESGGEVPLVVLV